MLNSGEIVRYGYLWAREADSGEESGRKSRPVCVAVRTSSKPAALFLFPITRQKPDSARFHFAISEIECRRGGLSFPSYLIIDEYNHVPVDAAYDLESPHPIGAFSPAFMRKVAARIKDVATRSRLRGVRRQD